MENNDNEINEEKKDAFNKAKYVVLLILVAIVAAVASSEFTLYYYTEQYNKLYYNPKEEASTDANKNIDAIAKSIKNFRKLIDNNFLGEIDENNLMEETLKGYINGLDDEYTEYMTAEEWADFQADALGNYVGIGIYMSVDKNGNVIVVSPIKDTPAEKAGIKTNDIIVAVDDESVLNASSDEVASKIKGEEGSTVKVTVYRDGEYKDFELVREAIKVYHVETRMLENDIGYISLLTFDEGCSEEFKNGYLELKNKGAKKIIIDLRNNTGGIVDEALKIIDMMVPKGSTMLVTQDSKGEEDVEIAKQDPIITEDAVLLVNGYSASASEIVTGALKDNNRVKVVGKTTYGKGVIQSVYQLSDGSALKLTIQEYLTPNKTKINKIGIEPDYDVELTEEDLASEDELKDSQVNKAIELLK